MFKLSNLQNSLAQLFAHTGFLFLFLFGALIPIFVWPVTWFPTFDTIMSESIFMKRFVLTCLATGVFAVAAGYVLVARNLRIAPEALMPAGAMLLWLLWGTASIYVNVLWDGLQGTWVFWNNWILVGFPGAAALFGLYALNKPWAATAMIYGMLSAAVIVAAIGVASWLGWRGYQVFVFGRDTREILEDAALAEFLPLVQGGTRSSFAMSTLANPEYAGTYTGVMICMALVMVFDWAVARRWHWVFRFAAFGLLALLMLELVFTTSRMGIITVGLLALFRFGLFAGVRVRWLAAGFCGFVWTILLFGVLWAGLLLVIYAVAIGVYTLANRGVRGLFKESDRLNFVLVVGGALLMATLLLAYSLPGPWNPSGLRVASRFTSLVQKSDNSLDERALMFIIASRMATERPIFGVGPGRYGATYFETALRISEEDDSAVLHLYRIRQGNLYGAQAHSDFLQIAAETGIVGIVIFSSALLFLAHGLLRVYRRKESRFRIQALVILFGLLGFAAIMMSSFPLQMPSRAAAFWAVVATALGIINGAALEKESLTHRDDDQ